MLLVGEIMQAGPVCVDAEQSVVATAQRMRDHGLQRLPVCRDGAYVGMVRQSDVVTRCVAAGLDPATTPVAEVMCAEDPVEAESPAEEALILVLRTGRRHLPVVQDGRLVGMLSQADLVDELPDDTVNGILAVVSRG